MCVLFVKSLLSQTGTLTPEKLEQIRLAADVRQSYIQTLNLQGKGK